RWERALEPVRQDGLGALRPATAARQTGALLERPGVEPRPVAAVYGWRRHLDRRLPVAGRVRSPAPVDTGRAGVRLRDHLLPSGVERCARARPRRGRLG